MMAEQLALVRRCDFATADISSVSLLNSSGIEIAENGWQPQVIPFGENEITEAMTFIVNGTSDNALATTVQAIYQKSRECEYSKSLAEPYQVWLVDQLAGETNARQAVVKSMDFVPGASLHDYYPIRNSHTWKGAQLGLVRGHWEGTASTDTVISDTSSLGGNYSMGTVAGDLPGRLADIAFSPHAGAAAQTEFWWGFRSSLYGVTPGSIQPLCEAESGTATGGTAVTYSADATAHGGTTSISNLSSCSSMTTMITWYLTNFSATRYIDLRGQFTLLARCHSDSSYGGTLRMRFSHGMDNALSYNDAMDITNTGWKLLDFGNVSFPAGGAVYSGIDTMKYSRISMQAQYAGTGLMSGTPNLYLDCIILIPSDEGCGHIEGASGETARVFCDALDRVTAIDYSSTNITNLSDTTGCKARNSTVPVGASSIIVAGQGTASVLADSMDVTVKYYPRWFALRGSS